MIKRSVWRWVGLRRKKCWRLWRKSKEARIKWKKLFGVSKRSVEDRNGNREGYTTRYATLKGHIHCTLQLLCFGVEIDERIGNDKITLLDRSMKLLRSGSRMGISLLVTRETFHGISPFSCQASCCSSKRTTQFVHSSLSTVFSWLPDWLVRALEQKRCGLNLCVCVCVCVRVCMSFV